MPIAQRAIVNQRLYFCQLHLRWLQQQLDDQQLPRHVVEQSLGESLNFHLVMAYRAYLAEVAQTCSVVAPTTLTQAADLAAVLQEKQRMCAAVSQLQVLEAQDSWLSHLLSNYEQPGLIPGTAVKATTTAHIPLQQLSDSSIPAAIDHGRQLLIQLTILIDQQREQLEEW